MSTTHTRVYDRYAPALAEYAGMDAEDPRRAALRDHLVRAFRPVARNIAARYARRGEPSDDLEQVATIGLINALNRFEPGEGREFLSYAIPTMMGEVRRHFRDSSWSIRTPRDVKERYLRVGSAASTWSQAHGRAPTIHELAEYLGAGIDEVREAYAAGSSYRPASLDRTLTESDETTLVEMLGVIDPDLDQVENRTLVGALVSELPERERTLLRLRFVNEMSQREIAAELCISQMHVSRLLSRTLGLLRERLVSDDELDHDDTGARVAVAG